MHPTFFLSSLVPARVAKPSSLSFRFPLVKAIHTDPKQRTTARGGAPLRTCELWPGTAVLPTAELRLPTTPSISSLSPRAPACVFFSPKPLPLNAHARLALLVLLRHSSLFALFLYSAFARRFRPLTTLLLALSVYHFPPRFWSGPPRFSFALSLPGWPGLFNTGSSHACPLFFFLRTTVLH